MPRSGVRVHVTSSLEDATGVLMAPRHLREEEWCNRRVYEEGRFSCLTSRRYGLPEGTSHVCTSLKYLSASSGVTVGSRKTEPFMPMESWLLGQFAGVAIDDFADNWRASTTRQISSMLANMDDA